MPPLNALRAFESAARQQSFGQAADELGVTPAAISQQIKALESYLGLVLFHRVGRRVVMSQEAQLILPELKAAFGLIEKGLSRLGQLGQSETGLLTISASLAFTAMWLLPRLHRFKEQYPQIDIRLDANDRMTRFGEEGIDAAIRFGSGEYPGLTSLPLGVVGKEGVIPVCSPALLKAKQHPLKSPEDLRYHTLIHDDAMSGEGKLPTWTKWLSDAGIYTMDTLRGLHFSNSMLAIEAAIDGQGVALSSSFLVQDDLAAGHLLQPFSSPGQTEYNYHLVFPEHRPNKKIEYFYHWLMQVCAR